MPVECVVYRSRLFPSDLFACGERTDKGRCLPRLRVRSSGLTVLSCCFSGAVGSASAGRASQNDWEASASVMFLPWLRGVGDVSGGYGTVPVVFSSILASRKLNVNTNLYTYLFGLRASVFRLCRQVGAVWTSPLSGWLTKAFRPTHLSPMSASEIVLLRLISEEVSTSAWSAESLGACRRTTCKPSSSTPPNTIRA